MPRTWLAAVATAAVLGCGDDDSGGGPSDLFPDVAGVYQVHGSFDGFTEAQAVVNGSVTIEQESQEQSTLTGTATLAKTGTEGTLTLTNVELQGASVTLSGIVSFTLGNTGGGVTWSFSGERAGNVLEGQHTLTEGATTTGGDWTGER